MVETDMASNYWSPDKDKEQHKSRVALASFHQLSLSITIAIVPEWGKLAKKWGNELHVYPHSSIEEEGSSSRLATNLRLAN